MDTYTQPVPTKRRYLELEQKRRIVEETLAEGASVAQIARVQGVNANRVFNWRRLYRARGNWVAGMGTDCCPYESLRKIDHGRLCLAPGLQS